MSAIASWYLLEEEDLPKLRELAPLPPVKTGKHFEDQFSSRLNSPLTLNRDFTLASGYIFLPVIEYLEAHGFPSAEASSQDFASFLSEMRESSYFLFDAKLSKAALTCAALKKQEASQLEEFFERFLPGAWDRLTPEYVREACLFLQKGLSEVKGKTYLLFHIG